MAAAEEDARDPVAALPPALTLRVFALVPLDTRLRCAEVCPGWHKALADTSLWAELDLTQLSSGVACTGALLCAATKRARGGLQTLRLPDFRLSHATLCGIVAANAATLRELRFGQGGATRDCEHVVELLRAAPQLRLLEADMWCGSVDDLQRVLRREPPFGALRMRLLEVRWFNEDAADANMFTAFSIALAADLAASTASFTGLRLYNVPLSDRAALDAVVDAALARSLSTVELIGCGLSPASAAALARLLRAGALTHFGAEFASDLEPDEPATALLGAALRASTLLTSLTLLYGLLWYNPTATVALLDAVTAHPSLRTLNFTVNSFNGTADFQVAAGAALSRLLVADAPFLQTLRINSNELGDAGLGPLFDALPRNTHLRTLDCSDNNMSAAFARDRLLPAVRDNTLLRELHADPRLNGAVEAMELVTNRR
jgi:hypothetical protein